MGMHQTKPDILESLYGEIVSTNKILIDRMIESGNSILYKVHKVLGTQVY